MLLRHACLQADPTPQAGSENELKKKKRKAEEAGDEAPEAAADEDNDEDDEEYDEEEEDDDEGEGISPESSIWIERNALRLRARGTFSNDGLHWMCVAQ